MIYDMIHFLTANGLTPGVTTTEHIYVYTQKIQRTKNSETEYQERKLHINKNTLYDTCAKLNRNKRNIQPHIQ